MSKSNKPAVIPNKLEAEKEGQISFKKLGANLILTVPPKEQGGKPETLSRKVTTEESEAVKKKVMLYNKKPTDKLMADIVKLMTPVAAKKKAEKEVVVAAKKAVERKAKKDAPVQKKADKNFLEQLEEYLSSEESPEVAVAKLDGVLDKFRKKEEVKTPEKPVVSAPARRYGGEYR